MTVDDGQLQDLLKSGQALADVLSLEGRYMHATVVAGLVQTVRALRTKLEPPKVDKAEPHLKPVPLEAEPGVAPA